MKKCLLVILLGLFDQYLFGQQDISLSNIVPPSPEASAFAKFGTYPVGTYTGRPDITIPIFNIQDGNLSVPISISYDATGIRVNEMAGWAGMNWSLNAGGMVSQMVVGQPDIANNSIPLAAVPPRASEIVNNSTYFNYFQSLVEGDQAAPAKPDADPDKFFYSFNGRSGSFVFDRNRNIMQIPKTSLQIVVIGTMQGFRITDEAGIVYTFNSQEKTETYAYSAAGPSPVLSTSGSIYKSQTTGYYLTEIASSNAAQHIYFTYENEITSAKDETYSETKGPKFNQGNQFPTSFYHGYRWSGTQRVITVPRLKTITFSNGKVEFSRVSGRLDDETTSSRIDEISFYNKNAVGTYTKLKSFKFIHGYFYSSQGYAQYSCFPGQTMDRYRLRLDTIYLKDASGAVISNYSFTYNSTSLPPKRSCSQDWWGYYNGESNTTLVPTTSVPDGSGGTTIIGGANKNSVESYMKAGTLEKMKYPTGGYTMFEMESHKLYSDYMNVSESHSASAQGMSSNNLVVQSFVAPSLIDNASCKLLINIGPYSSSNPVPFAKVKNMSTGVEQTFTSTDLTNWYSEVVPYTFTAGVTYQLTSSNYVNQSYGTTNITATFIKTIYSPNTNPVGGLRIKSIKNYTADNILANEENYTYGQNENGGGVFVGILGGSYSYSKSQRVYYADNGNQCQSIGGAGSEVYDMFLGGPLFDPALVQGSPVVYTDVVKYYGNSSNNAGKTVYNYGTAAQQLVETRPLPSDNRLANNQGILIINDAWKKGLLLKQQDYKLVNGSYSLVQEDQRTYNILYADTTYGLMAQTKFDRVITNPSCASRNFDDYAWAEYPVYTGYVQLAQTTKNEYSSDNNGIIQTVVTHTYDNNHKDIEVKTNTVSSTGEALEAEKKYPFNKAQLLTSITPAESTALDDMVTKNIIAPVEEIGRKNSVQISLKKTSYEYVNGSTIAPVNIKFQNGSYPLEARLLFTKYDAFGNLLEQQKVNDQKKSYIWDYQNRYPIAEVSNASQTDIAFTSFEADGNGNWTIGSATRDAVYFVTGANSYSLSSGNISKSGLVVGNKYILSYWSRSGSYLISGASGSLISGRMVNGWVYYEHGLTASATTITISGSGNIDELRLYPASAQMTSYTFSPLIGMTTLDDAGSHISYFQYDSFDRMEAVKDQDGNIIKTIKYHYLGQP